MESVFIKSVITDPNFIYLSDSLQCTLCPWPNHTVVYTLFSKSVNTHTCELYSNPVVNSVSEYIFIFLQGRFRPEVTISDNIVM